MKQNVFTLHANVRRKFKRRKIVATGLHYQMQMDLIDLNSIKGYNFNSRYILTSINIFSRKAYVQPLRNKHHRTVLKALENLFQHCPYPMYLQTDQGTEFLSSPMRKYLKDRCVKHFYTSSDTKYAIVERFNRTLKTRMFKYFTANHTLHYLDVLQRMIDAYNRRVHRSLGIAPNDVTLANEKDIWDYEYKNYF